MNPQLTGYPISSEIRSLHFPTDAGKLDQFGSSVSPDSRLGGAEDGGRPRNLQRPRRRSFSSRAPTACRLRRSAARPMSAGDLFQLKTIDALLPTEMWRLKRLEDDKAKSKKRPSNIASRRSVMCAFATTTAAFTSCSAARVGATVRTRRARLLRVGPTVTQQNGEVPGQGKTARYRRPTTRSNET